MNDRHRAQRTHIKNMSTTPQIPLDYLQVPTNQSLVDSKPHRSTSSFIEKSSQCDERIASNLSLPLVGNSILKQANSSRQPSHLIVHYTPTTNEDTDEIESIRSLMPPKNESSTLIENLPKNNQHVFKIPTHYGLWESSRKSTLLNQFLHRRYENNSKFILSK